MIEVSGTVVRAAVHSLAGVICVQRRGGFRLPKKGATLTDSTRTLIAALLDRSGSMSTSVEATEDGWRELISEQRANPGLCEVTLAQFNTAYEVVYPPTDIAGVPEFALEPRGMTALLDAVGRLITEVGERLSALPEEQRPGQVICLIMTDGHENSSRQWTWETVKALITQQREVYGWEFLFLGADIDAIEVGARMGMAREYSMTYDKRDYPSNRAAFASTHDVISRKRRYGKSDDDGFSDEDRKRAMGR
jgi:uncharacterized protein YegL